MKGQRKNGLILLAVIVVVGGVAWFRFNRTAASATTDGTAVAAESEAGDISTAAKLPRVVDLGAGKCKACKDLAPILEELKKEYAGRVKVEFIDVWENPKAGDPYDIRTIPTQVFFDADGKEVWRHEGFLAKAEFVAKFKELGVP